MRFRRAAFLGFVVAIAMLFVACSSSSSSTPASSSSGAPQATAAAPAAAKPAAVPHACDILQTADAQLVLGSDAILERSSESSCDLETPNPLGPSIQVKIEPVSDVWDGGETMMRLDKEARKVPDIGEGGYTFGGGTIVFKKGGWEVSVITSTYKGNRTKYEAAHLIAERLAARM